LDFFEKNIKNYLTNDESCGIILSEGKEKQPTTKTNNNTEEKIWISRLTWKL
jgi:hypothetical protein